MLPRLSHQADVEQPTRLMRRESFCCVIEPGQILMQEGTTHEKSLRPLAPGLQSQTLWLRLGYLLAF